MLHPDRFFRKRLGSYQVGLQRLFTAITIAHDTLTSPEQRASGATAVMVSSDLDRLLKVTDRVGMMYRGQLIFDGTTEQARASGEPRVRQFVHGLTEGPL